MVYVPNLVTRKSDEIVSYIYQQLGNEAKAAEYQLIGSLSEVRTFDFMPQSQRLSLSFYTREDILKISKELLGKGSCHHF